MYLPLNVDVIKPRDQGSCKAGYAFATAASIESVRAIQEGILKEVSPQQLIDCSDSYGNLGCDGGSAVGSLNYYIKTGVASEVNYSY